MDGKELFLGGSSITIDMAWATGDAVWRTGDLVEDARIPNRLGLVGRCLSRKRSADRTGVSRVCVEYEVWHS